MSGETRLMRRQQLTEAQIAALFDPPTDRRELVRNCTLSEADTAMIRRCRGDHSRLGYAVMLCYLRYPGRPLRINERPPAALISFVAEQIDVRPECCLGHKSPPSDALWMPGFRVRPSP
jgi:TnpA family transposase